MLKRRTLMGSAAAGFTALAAGLPFKGAFAQARAITIGHPSDVPSWDPLAVGSPSNQSVYKCLFDQPLSLAPDLSFGPSVATRFRWLDSEGKVLELTLRDDVTFHNGDKLTSADIKFSFLDRLKADNSLMLSGVFGALIADIETPSPTTAIIKLANTFVTLPQQLSSTASFIVPKAHFERVGAKAFAENPIGSGPYRLVDYQRDSRIVFEAYDKYWGGKARIERVVFQIVKDPSARIAAIQSGQVDFISAVPVREVTRLGALPGLAGVAHPINNVFMIHMVNKGIYRDKNVRLAMHHAIDKAALSRAFFNNAAIPLSMWAGPGAPAHDPKFEMAFDPARARTLLAASGYNATNPAKIAFGTMNGVFPSDFDIARAMVQMWKNVGIDADLQVMDVNNYNDMARNDRLEFPVLWSWSNPTGDPNVYSGTIIDPKKRFSVWKSDDISPRLDPLLAETNYDKRMAGYREFDRWAVEQGYAFPLLQSTSNVVHSNRIRYVPYANGWTLPYAWSAA